MKHSIRTIQLALVGTVLLSSAAHAKPFPKRGYILKDKGTANIGRRASTLDAQRAALRMMARLMKWAPNEASYSVDWTTLDSKGKEQMDGASFGVDEDQVPQKPEDRRPSLITSGSVYWPVSQSIVRRVARYSGSFRDLTRYGVVDQIQEVRIDLGVRKSYDAGSRATLRVLAKRLQGPFSASYSIRWSYPSKEGGLNEVTVLYNPSTAHDNFYVMSYPFPGGTRLNKSVTERSIIQVGRRSGTFDDLPDFISANKESWRG